MAAQEQTFRFLDLPAELRCMVYEFLPIMTKHHTIQMKAKPHYALPDDQPASLTLITKEVSVQLLRTCRLVHAEAKQIVAAKLDVIKRMTPRLFLDSHAAPLMNRKNGVIDNVMGYYYSLQARPSTDLTTWLAGQPKTPSEPVLRFFYQAGLQFLTRQQNSEMFTGVDDYDGAWQVWLFIGCKMRLSPWHARKNVTVQKVLEGMLRDMRSCAPLSLSYHNGTERHASSDTEPGVSYEPFTLDSLPWASSEGSRDVDLSELSVWEHLGLADGWDGDELECRP